MLQLTVAWNSRHTLDAGLPAYPKQRRRQQQQQQQQLQHQQQQQQQ